ncbi:hypothetical protein D3C87_1257300 [compost metagenome]
MAARDAVRAVKRFGEAPTDLVEDQANQRLGAADVGRRHHQVQRNRMLGRDQVRDVPVAARGDLGHRGVAVQAEERHSGGQHTRALVLALVEDFARSRGHHRMHFIRQMPRGHHATQRDLEGTGRIGQEIGDAAQRLVLARIEHVQDGADQQRMAGLLPVVAALQGAFRVDQDVGDVLNVTDFVCTAPHFEQRVVRGRLRIGRIEQQAVREARAPAGREAPVLALDVVDHGRARPGQQRGHHETHAFA